MCESKILVVSCSVFGIYRFAIILKLQTVILYIYIIKSGLNQIIPLTTKTLISLEQIAIKSFYINLVLI